MYIEMGADELKATGTSPEEIKELEEFGDQRAIALGATGLSTDFRIGYELGLATARAWIQEAADPRAL